MSGFLTVVFNRLVTLVIGIPLYLIGFAGVMSAVLWLQEILGYSASPANEVHWFGWLVILGVPLVLTYLSLCKIADLLSRFRHADSE